LKTTEEKAGEKEENAAMVGFLLNQYALAKASLIDHCGR